MATKKVKQQKKPAAPSRLPPGVKPARHPISPEKLKMLMEDRGIASGGRNVVQRQPASR